MRSYLLCVLCLCVDDHLNQLPAMMVRLVLHPYQHAYGAEQNHPVDRHGDGSFVWRADDRGRVAEKFAK